MRPIGLFCLVGALVASLGTTCIRAQVPSIEHDQSPESTRWLSPDDISLPVQDPQQSGAAADGKSSAPDAPTPKTNRTEQNESGDQSGKQPRRILWIIPNYRAVSANTHLPPLSFKNKLWLATEDTFDYSDVIFVGGLAGISMASKSQPSFGQGGAGYGRYYWHIFVDGGIENYMTEAIMPVATKEDPRYYTLGKGGFFKRSGYAVSRLVLTRTDAGKTAVNISEIVGAGAAAGIGNAYYPAQTNPWVKTYQRWGTQLGLDGVFNVLKEFWPDIDRAVFHGEY